MPEEKELVQKILSGDREAQDLFYRDYARRLYPVCVHFLGTEDSDAEDIVQDTFMVAWRKLGGFRFESSLYTWLNHICVNLCFERLRKRKKTLVSLEEDMEKLTQPHQGWFQKRKAEEEEQEKSALLARLHRIMDSMGEKCRHILILRDREGHSYTNLAKMLKIPPGTVMSQLARCRKALKHLMSNELKEAKP